MELVNLSLTVGLLFFCGLCAHHGMTEYVSLKSPPSRHVMQCGVAFSVGIVVVLIETGLNVGKLMTPLLSLIVGSIRNGIIHIIIYHGVVNLCIEMVLEKGKIESKKSMRRQLVVGWTILTAAYIPYGLRMGAFFYYTYTAVRCLIFIWYIFPIVRWYHRRSKEARDFVTQYRTSLLKYANFCGMLHPMAVFLSRMTHSPISYHVVLGFVMTIIFYLGYVTPDGFKRLMYRWFYPLPDSSRLGFLTTLAASQNPSNNASLLEVWLRRFGNHLSTPAEQLHSIVESVYFRDLGRLPHPEPEAPSPASAVSGGQPPSDTASSAQDRQGGVDFIEDVLGYREVGNILRYVSERWDGSGPHGLSGREIPKEARILALMETFVGELYISENPHAALEAIRARQGELDPDLVAALAQMIDEDAASPI